VRDGSRAASLFTKEILKKIRAVKVIQQCDAFFAANFRAPAGKIFAQVLDKFLSN
jgi:hypothetical protein